MIQFGRSEDMRKLMEKPTPHPYYNTTYEDAHYNRMTGQEVLDKFFNQGIWHENHIPKELEDKNWKPELNKYYKVWWDSTDPADPADSGIDFICYIEEYTKVGYTTEAVKLWSSLMEKLNGRSNEEMRKIINFVDNL